MSAKPRGLCVIFQNDTFNDSSMDRTGCYDAELLKKSFTDLGFKVIEEPNLRAVEMYEKILNYSKMDEHSQYDCFVLCISSHGNANGVFGIDGNTLAVKDVTSLFAGPICENLRGKPKLFFISACRNEERNKAEMKEEREMDDAATSDGSSPYSFESGAKKRSALEDIYEGYSTPHGIADFCNVNFSFEYFQYLYVCYYLADQIYNAHGKKGLVIHQEQAMGLSLP